MALLLATGACGDAARESRTTVTYERVDALRLQAVDNDSDYMRRLYVHLGTDQADRPSDAAALGAGVTAGKADYWVVGDRPQKDYFLEAHDRGPVSGRTLLASYFQELEARDPSFAVPASREIVFQQSEPGVWRSYFVEEHVALDGTAVTKAEANEEDDRATVLVDLDDAGARALGRLTDRITGHKLAMISGGTVLVAPIINDAIHGGMFSISLAPPDSIATAESLVAALDR